MTTPRSKVATHYLTKVLALAALALVGSTIFSRLHWLYLNPWPMDYLGFYYLKELEFRAIQGTGYYERISPFFSVFSLLFRTSGLSSAIFFNLIILFTYFVWTVAALVTATDSKRSSWSKLEICFCLLLLIWGSDVVFSAIYSYPRQGIALGFLACGVLLLYPQHRPYTKVIGFTCISCAVAFHIFAAIFLVAIGVGYAATTRSTRSWSIGLITLGIAVFIFRFNYQPKDLSTLFSLSALPLWIQGYQEGWLSPRQCLEYWLQLFILLGLLVSSARGRIINIALTSLFCLALIAPLWDSSEGSFGRRFLITSPWITFAVLCFALRSTSLQLVHSAEQYLGLGCLGLLGTMLFAPNVGPPIGPKIPVAFLIENREALSKWLPQESYIKAPHGIQFAATYLFECRAGTEWPKNQQFQNYVEISENAPDSLSCLDIRSASIDSSCVRIGPGVYAWKWAASL